MELRLYRENTVTVINQLDVVRGQGPGGAAVSL